MRLPTSYSVDKVVEEILHFAFHWLCNMPSKLGRSMAFGRKDGENGVMSNASHGNFFALKTECA